ncbi:MAG TPA: uridine kinase [Bacteroidetes bacterium]|nr:uridine kinase [Bacteroidota bacterium]
MYLEFVALEFEIYSSIMTPLVIGVAGGSGSGKTSVTSKIVEQLDSGRVAVLQFDAYYKDLPAFGGSSAGEINFDHPDSLETSLLIEHIKALKKRQGVDAPVYNFATNRRMTETRRVDPSDVIFIDGILIFVDAELRELMDIKIYVDTDADERLVRRIRRDILERGRSLESVIQQYLTTVKPMHLQFVEPSKHWADVIIPRGAENAVAIDVVVAKIRAMQAL